MDDVTKTDKMLVAQGGRVGYVIFNNPERHNAVSLDMWAATSRILDDFAKDDEVRVVVLTGAGGKAFVSGADISKFESERATARRDHALQRHGREGLRRRPRVSQADHRDDPRLLHRRRARARGLLRSAHLLRQFEVRGAGGQARAGLLLCRPASGSSTWSGRRSPRRSSTPRASSTPRRRAPWGWSIASCPTAELETYVKNYAETIAGNAPLTIKAVKFIVGEVAEGRKQAQSRALRRNGRAVLRQQRLHRGPHARSWRSASRHSPGSDPGFLGRGAKKTARRQAVTDAGHRFGVSIAIRPSAGNTGRIARRKSRGVG